MHRIRQRHLFRLGTCTLIYIDKDGPANRSEAQNAAFYYSGFIQMEAGSLNGSSTHQKGCIEMKRVMQEARCNHAG